MRAAWEKSVAEEDFSPYMPREEFEFRIQRAKALLAQHGIDAMVLFAYGNKQYYGGFLESNYRFTDRWRPYGRGEAISSAVGSQ